MANINLVGYPELLGLGLPREDAEAFLDMRAALGPFETTDEVLKSDLPRSALVRIRELIASGDLDAKTDSGALQITLRPLPEVTDLPPGRAVLRYRTTDGNDVELEVQVPFGGPTVVTRQKVDLDRDIGIAVTDANGVTLRNERYAAERVRDLSIASIFAVTLDLRTLPGLREAADRFDRKGRFVVPGDPTQRFDGYRMLFAPVAEAGLDAARALASASNATMPEIGALSGFSWEEATLDIDGSFTIFREIAPADRAARGWLWMLAGPGGRLGFHKDPDLTTPDHDVTIPLSGEGLSALDTGDIPFDFSEATLLRRPDIFSEEPGLACRPFDNPARIIDEKSFATVLRVSDPEIGQPFPLRRRPIGRYNEVEWEGNATRNQARSLAFGHIVEFRVRTRSAGYSLGNAVHSMTLAPRQTRQILRVDYRRRERESRRERTEAADRVSQSTTRDRSYYDAVQSQLSEWSRGGSTADVSAGAVGAGFAIPPFVMGGGAATSSATSTAWQRGGRSVAAAERQKLRDAIRQHGDSIRTLESTVIEELSEQEGVTGVSEVVRNINYCHALSVVYYEILRHLRVDTEIGGVSECLFIPLEVRPFTDARIRRHREVLARNLPDRDHRLAMRYLEDIQSNFASGDIPDGTRASQPLTSLTGSVHVRMGIARPTEGDVADDLEADLERELSETPRFRKLVQKLAIFAAYTGKSPTALAHEILSVNEAARDRYFQREIAPHMARAFADRMRIGRRENGAFTPLDADLTLVSTYRYDNVLRIDFRVETDGTLRRQDIENLVFLAPPEGAFQLPEHSFANVTRAEISISTDYYSRRVRSSGRNQDDLVAAETGLPTADGATMRFPLSRYEEQNMRERLTAAYDALKNELSENLYFYHKVIWWNMDRDELFAMLDGFSVSAADPRSLASVVERQPIGIMGNALVFRAAAGSLLDPRFDSPEALLAYYRDEVAVADPMRISLPTGGVYARAHMDECNACEEHGGTRDWVLEQPDPDLADLPASLLVTRRGPERDLGPSSLPETLINLQNAPAAPAPTGLQGALDAAASSDAFRDITGLQGTQNLAQQGLTTASGLATSFGDAALRLKLAELKADEDAGKKLAAAADAAQKAVDKGQMDGADAQDFVKNFAKKLSGDAGEDKMTLVEEASDLSAALGPTGAATVARTGTDGASVVSFDKSGLLAQAAGSGDPLTDPVAQFRQARALVEAAQDWADARTAETTARREQLENAGFDEFAFWGSDPADPNAGRLTEGVARRASAHPRRDEVAGRLREYVETVRPGLTDARYDAIVESYARSSSAWSAVFISHLMARAGIGADQGFRTSRSHSHYIVEALINRLNRDYEKPFWLFRPTEVPVAEGDIVVRSRGGGGLSFDRSLVGNHPGTAPRPIIRFRNGQWSHRSGYFDSHTDMVLDLETNPGFVDTIGGNTSHLDGTSNTVGKRRYQVQADGTLGPEVDDANAPVANAQVPWAIIRILDATDFDRWAQIVEDVATGEDDSALSVDSFLEVFGEDTAAGGRVLRAPVLQTLQADGNGRAIFGRSAAADFSDIDKSVRLKPFPRAIPSNVG